jgi:hypothetical protein
MIYAHSFPLHDAMQNHSMANPSTWWQIPIPEYWPEPEFLQWHYCQYLMARFWFLLVILHSLIAGISMWMTCDSCRIFFLRVGSAWALATIVQLHCILLEGSSDIQKRVFRNAFKAWFGLLWHKQKNYDLLASLDCSKIASQYQGVLTISFTLEQGLILVRSGSTRKLWVRSCLPSSHPNLLRRTLLIANQVSLCPACTTHAFTEENWANLAGSQWFSRYQKSWSLEFLLAIGSTSNSATAILICSEKSTQTPCEVLIVCLNLACPLHRNWQGWVRVIELDRLQPLACFYMSILSCAMLTAFNSKLIVLRWQQQSQSHRLF